MIRKRAFILAVTALSRRARSAASVEVHLASTAATLRRRATALLGLALVASSSSCRSQPVEQRVLFIGNSYVATNDLPGTFRSLAAARRHRVEVGMLAEGGWLLQQHVESPNTANELAKGPWTAVVLQEQSMLPAYRLERQRTMYPAVRTLVEMVRARHAKPMLLSTWARRDGLPTGGFPDFARMQAELDEGYRAIAEETSSAIIPAGPAWAMAHERSPDLALWAADGSHPSAAGTYLTACVLYAAFFGESPERLPLLLGVDSATARSLQQVAARVVLAPPAP